MAYQKDLSPLVAAVGLVLLSCVFSSRVNAFDGCNIRYGRRGCIDGTYEGVLVTCNGYGEYPEIPPVIPSDTVYISLTNFRFDVLMRANFTKFKMVQCMSLMDSGITGIEFDTFADMDLLQELELRNVNIDGSQLQFMNHPDFKPVQVSVTNSPMITELSFPGTLYMEKVIGLNLKGNRISLIQPSLFHFLKNLVSLDLSDNQLSDLEWDKLSDMTKLNALYLSGNNLQNIPRRVFRTFFAVKELKIAGNPFHCNCDLRWLKDFYKDTSDRIIDLKEVQCMSPFKTLMIQTEDGKFGCSRPSLPIIEWHSIEGMDDHYAFNCSSLADPAPTLTFLFPKYMKLITPPNDDLSNLKTSTPRIISKPGAITCIATNSEGSRQKEEYVPAIGGASSLVRITWSALFISGFVMSSRKLL